MDAVGYFCWRVRFPMADSIQIRDVSPDNGLTSARFHEILAGGSGPIAFRGDMAVDATKDSSDQADITVIVANPGVSGRGSAELIIRLWREFPRVAALLGDDLTDIGSVIFSEKARGELRGSAAKSANPVTMAVARAVSQGLSLKAEIEKVSPRDAMALRPPLLVPGDVSARRRELGRVIAEIPPERLVSPMTNQSDGRAIISGLLLWHDLLDESHSISQSVEGRGRHVAGDYWHAIMHRREPDYGNAKYWFRRVGTQPIFSELAERAGRYIAGTSLADSLSDGRWNSAAFVDACQEVTRSRDAESDLALRRCQADEILLLLEQTRRDAAS